MAIQKRDEILMDARPTATGSDLTGKEMRVVTRTANGDIRLAQVGEAVCGVIQEGKAAGYASSFAFGGILKCIASGAITPGQQVMAGQDGSVVAGATNPIGRCRNSVLSGEIAEVQYGN